MEPILSPFSTNNNETFIEELGELCDKYGFDQWFISYSEPYSQSSEQWFGFCNTVSDGMVAHLEEAGQILSSLLEITEED